MIKSDGTIENKSRSIVGYVKEDGTIENRGRSLWGILKKTSRSTIGYA